MNWCRRCVGWIRIALLEGRLQRGGYRRLHQMQVEEAKVRTKRVIHDLADAVIMLRSVAEQVESALEDLDDGGWDD